MSVDHRSCDDLRAELLELTAAEAEDFARFVALRGGEAPVEEVRALLAMIERYPLPGRGDPDRLPSQLHHHALTRRARPGKGGRDLRVSLVQRLALARAFAVSALV